GGDPLRRQPSDGACQHPRRRLLPQPVDPATMLNTQTLDKLHELNFTGMIRALEEQDKDPEIAALSFDERLGLLIDRELSERDSRRLQRRLSQAKLRQEACMEDVDSRAPRGLDKTLMATLATCVWIAQHLNVLITGPTGVGKSFIASALAHKACLEGYKALYVRLPRLLDDVRISRGDGTYAKRLRALAKIDLVVLDDWGLAKLTPDSQRDLLEVLRSEEHT